MATIRDVARAVGVSAATVSYVINNGPRQVRKETRERVLQAMEELNYHPSAIARGLQGKRMNTVGVITSETPFSLDADPFCAPILDGIIRAAVERNQMIMLFAGETWRDPVNSAPIFCDGRCDGLLLLAPRLDDGVVRQMHRFHVPIVVVGERTVNEGVSTVNVDDVKAIHILVGYLHSLGHRRIAFLNGQFLLGSSHDRMIGFLQAMEYFGLEITPGSVIPGMYLRESGYERTMRMLDWPSGRPTALLCCSDSIALGALDALAERNVSVPHQMTVVGINDGPLAAHANPPLTTINQKLVDQGLHAVAILMAQIDAGETAITAHTEQPTLVIRLSSGPPLAD